MHAFMFTDVEASTRLWEEEPEGMSAALTRHFEILSHAVETAGGEVVKTTGDGLVAVFDEPGAAATAATRAQLDLLTADLGVPIRVRIGIHAGETEARSGDFFGPTMNRTARIMAAGHGGQILVSGTIAELGASVLPPGASLRDLGFHRLKDLTLPERLHQLVHRDLPADFPPPVTLEASAHNFPLQTSEFLGRRHEINAIRSMLLTPGTRLITIFGPGGAGKTRLGLQVAAEVVDEFGDGAVFVDLAPERDPNAAFEAVVRALDLPASGSGSPLDLLQSRLRDREMLLILDNFEQVAEAAQGVVDLLQHCPRLKVLVTSREILKVRAEHVYPVPPLSLPDPRGDVNSIGESEAVQLFVDRVRSVRPDFVLDHENAADVARICLRLDGLPLAIELAAARLNLFDAHTLLERLEDRLDVLGSGGRDLPDRQRTLWGAIGWSYELLDEPSRQLVDMLSVFSSTRLESIESVASGSGHSVGLFDLLASLVDKSLLRSEDVRGSRRFSMLLMIKEFAAERLAEDPERSERVRRAHAEHFRRYTQDLSDRLSGPDRQEVIDELGLDIGNLRTAWRYWVDQRDAEQLFSMVGGLWALHDAMGWYHAAIELARDALDVVASSGESGERRAEELALRTSLARALMAVHGYGIEVENAYREVLEMAQASGDAARQYPVLRALATYYMNLGNWESSRSLGEQILEVGAAETDETMEIEGHFVVGASLAFLGETAQGFAHLDQVIASFDPLVHGASRYRLGPLCGVSAQVTYGLLLWQIGQLDEAVVRVRDALSIAESARHPYSVAYALYHNAFLDIWRGDFEACRLRAGKLAAIAEERDYAVWATLAILLQGVCLTMSGQPEEGVELTEASIELYQGLTTPPIFWPYILLLRAYVHGRAGEAEHGLELLEEAIEITGHDEPLPPEFLIAKGDLLMQMREPLLTDADVAYEGARELAKLQGTRLFELRALTRLLELRRRIGGDPDVASELREVYDQFTEGFDQFDLQAARTVLGLQPDTTTVGGD